MLEIGCAAGSYIHAMHKAGWSVEGLEFSEGAAAQARALGYRVHTGTVETAPAPDLPYDVVAGWMVLEHLHQPIAALRRLREWTVPGGWLALSVPDAGSWEFRCFGSSWYALQLPTHLFHFTPATLRKILDRSGWRVRRLAWHRNPKNLLYSLGYGWHDRGWTRLAAYVRDVADARRNAPLRIGLGLLLGCFHASGRITVWAQRD